MHLDPPRCDQAGLDAEQHHPRREDGAVQLRQRCQLSGAPNGRWRAEPGAQIERRRKSGHGNRGQQYAHASVENAVVPGRGVNGFLTAKRGGRHHDVFLQSALSISSGILAFSKSVSYGEQLTPAGAPVGAPIRSFSDASLRNSRCCIVGGSVGASVKNAPTVPFAHCRLNCPRSQFSALNSPAVVHSPTSFLSARISACRWDAGASSRKFTAAIFWTSRSSQRFHRLKT